MHRSYRKLFHYIINIYDLFLRYLLQIKYIYQDKISEDFTVEIINNNEENIENTKDYYIILNDHRIPNVLVFEFYQ